MLRHLFLYLSRQAWAYRLLLSNPLTRAMAWRFVAGETVEAALGVARRLAAERTLTILDPLGENVTAVAEAVAAADEAIGALRRIALAGVPAHLSIKLTQMGLDLGDDVCRAQVRRVLDCAREQNTFVCIDMEGSAYTERTLDLFADLQGQYGPDLVGTVLQSYLRRTPADLERLIERRARVRLVKGAYDEPAELAFPDKADVDRAYREQTEALLLRGNRPAIATQDARMIAHALEVARRHRISPERFEFQMLYGVRRDLQRRLAARGYAVRVYVPYGRQWYPYLMRRLAERPANVAFFARAAVRDLLPGRVRPDRRRSPGAPANAGQEREAIERRV